MVAPDHPAIVSHADQAAAAADAFHTASEAIAQKHGATLVRGPLKTADRIAQKINRDHGGDTTDIHTKVQDAMRNTIMAPKEQHAAIIADLKQQEGFVRHKPQPAEGYNGYEGNIVNRDHGGARGETQVVTPEMMVGKMLPETMRPVLGDEAFDAIVQKAGAKPGLGHQLYEEEQAAKERGDQAAAEAAAKKLQEYYAHFQ